MDEKISMINLKVMSIKEMAKDENSFFEKILATSWFPTTLKKCFAPISSVNY